MAALENITRDAWWYHYDMDNDVLYMRVLAHRDTPTLGEETPEGIIQLRSEKGGEFVGMTIVNWWNRFGKGELPDSIKQMDLAVQEWHQKHRIAA